MKNKIMIAITTYNRKDIIDLTSKSLSEIIGLNYDDVYIFDDCSTEFNISYLKKKYPGAHVLKSKNNLGADKNIERAYNYFLKSSYDYFFNADSDILFSKNILKKVNSIINKFDKNEPILFSVFNTLNHKVLSDLKNEFVIKKDVGACGCIFNKDSIKLFINKLPSHYDDTNWAVDYTFCSIYNNLGYKIYVTRNSLIQHIGYIGQNSNDFLFDWGIGFEVDSLTNAKAIIDLYEKNINLNTSGVEQKIIDYAKNGFFGVFLALKVLFITIKNKFKK
ncbi:MAG: glycosyltransferase family 2 protein [Bacilli bacterium]|nr:glycosyltransferase family 2 protein [Bacilli bacterium]